MTKSLMYQTLDHECDEIRLITILPLPPSTPENVRVECHMRKYRIDDDQYTPAYKKYLQSKNASGAWIDPRTPSHSPSECDEADDWVKIQDLDDDMTKNLPEFRYQWGDFMALSYTWGDPADCREILVNGHVLKVTQNVEAGLRVLRRKPYVQKGWKLWIDAISINQRDLEERAGQVKKMGKIYSKAWTPLIWLGEQRKGTNDALNLVASLASDYSSSDGVSQLTKTLRKDPDFFSKGSWRALYEIIIRPYWRRMWILQEVSRGRATTPVLCGHRTLSWYQFTCAFGILMQSDEVINIYMGNELRAASIPFDLEVWATIDTVRTIPALRNMEMTSRHKTMYPLLLRVDDITDAPIIGELSEALIVFNPEVWAYLSAVSEIQMVQDKQLAGDPTNLYSILSLSRAAFSIDPRDKVYGILGLMEDSLASLIEPDYTAPVLNVYRSFTLATIEATGSLDIIRHTTGPTTHSTMPTWIPNWTVASQTSALTLGETSFNVSGSSSVSIQVLPDLKLLSCKGFVIDHFDGMGAMWAHSWTSSSINQTKGSADPYGGFEAARKAIWTSLVACHSLPNVKLNADYGSLLATPALAEAKLPAHSTLKDIVGSNVLTWCVRSLKGSADFRVAGRPLRDYFWDKTHLEGIDAVSLRDGLMQKDRVGVRRRLATTRRGYVGMVLETAKTDDVIAILLGCSMPMVLRRSENEEESPGDVRWKVVGECYVHGIMDGEAMGWGIEPRDIVLC